MTLRRYWPILFLLLIHSLFLFPLFRPGFYVTHDGENHVARFAAYFTEFKDGSIPPRWAGNLNYHYGSPVLNFFYPLPGYLGSLLHLLDFSFQDAFKSIIGFAFLLSPITCYVWLRQQFSTTVALTGAFLYGLAPYHFLDVFVRGDIAEMVALAIIPIVFWTIAKKKIFAGAVAYGLFILSHNGVALLFSPVLLLYALVHAKHNWKQFTFIFVLGLGLSSFFWLPAIVELSNTADNLATSTMYLSHFPTYAQLIYSQWGFGPNVSAPDGLSPQIGPVLFLFAIGGFIISIKKKKLFWSLTFLVSLFLSLRISAPVWSALSLLKKLQFPWRFTALTSFTAVMLSCQLLTTLKKYWFPIATVVATLLLSIPMTKTYASVNHPDSYYIAFPGTTYYQGEAMTRWSAGDMGALPEAPVEIIAGQGSILTYKRTTVKHEYTVHADTEIRLLDNTFFYPGWRVSVDGKPTKIEFQDPSHRGLITFSVLPGQHAASVTFRETRFRLFTDILSITAFLGIIVFAVL